MSVAGTSSSTEGRALVERMGADLTAEGYRGELMASTEGNGFDVIVEMAAHLNLDHDLDMLARGGRVCVVGNRGPVTIDARKTMSKESSIHGVMLFGMTPEERETCVSAIHRV